MAPTDGLVTSPELCRLAGITYRQLDHWTRNDVLRASRPARGSGSFRGWTIEEVATARVCGQLARLGATAPVMSAVVRALETFPELWSGRVVVDPAGTVVPVGPQTRRDGWIVDLSAARDWVGAAPVTFDGATTVAAG